MCVIDSEQSAEEGSVAPWQDSHLSCTAMGDSTESRSCLNWTPGSSPPIKGVVDLSVKKHSLKTAAVQEIESACNAGSQLLCWCDINCVFIQHNCILGYFWRKTHCLFGGGCDSDGGAGRRPTVSLVNRSRSPPVQLCKYPRAPSCCDASVWAWMLEINS